MNNTGKFRRTLAISLLIAGSILSGCATQAPDKNAEQEWTALDAAKQAQESGEYREAARGYHKLIDDENNAAAKAELAELYSKGLGVEADAEYAEQLNYEAASQGNAKGEFNWGIRQITKGNNYTGYKWLEKAANQGHADAQFWLALGYEDGKGSLTQDWKAAIELYEKSASQGNGQAQQRLGQLYQNGVKRNGIVYLEQDDDMALRWFRQARKNGIADANVDVAKLYDKGAPGATKKMAIAAYREAAMLGVPAGEEALGDAYLEGDLGMWPDRDAAMYWYSQAGRKGRTSAQMKLVKLHLSAEERTERNKESAAYWLAQAAKSGDKQANKMMGEWLDQGYMVGKSGSDAAKRYRRLARTGDTESMMKLALLYEQGAADLRADKHKAVKWYLEAARLDAEGARKALDRVLEDFPHEKAHTGQPLYAGMKPTSSRYIRRLGQDEPYVTLGVEHSKTRLYNYDWAYILVPETLETGYITLMDF